MFEYAGVLETTAEGEEGSYSNTTQCQEAGLGVCLSKYIYIYVYICMCMVMIWILGSGMGNTSGVQ